MDRKKSIKKYALKWPVFLQAKIDVNLGKKKVTREREKRKRREGVRGEKMKTR